jgi:hypothetical protein
MRHETGDNGWRVHRVASGPAPGEGVTLSARDRALTFAQVVDGWREDEAFRRFFLAALADTPYPAFYWEMPPIGRGSMDRPYEYMVLEGGALERIRPDPAAFLEQFDGPGTPGLVACFRNLGGDATLVAPQPVAGVAGYGHIGPFLRSAPAEQQHALLKTLAAAVDLKLQRTDERIWISTAGLGVPWLHVRLDSRPKYYKHEPYRMG